MPVLNYRDILGGGLLIVIGVIAVLYGYVTLDLGTLNRMGPGMFPVALGCLQIAFGILILVQAHFTAGSIRDFDLRATISVTSSIIVFGLSARTFGMIPATVLLILVASLADSKISRRQILGLVLAVPVAAWLIFIVGLGLPLAAFRWPF